MGAVPTEFIPGFEGAVGCLGLIGGLCCFNFLGRFGSPGQAVLFLAGVNDTSEPSGLGAVVSRVPSEGTVLVDEGKGVRAEPVRLFGVGWLLLQGCIVSECQVEQVAFG